MKLPLNCTVNYFSDFLTQTEAQELYEVLFNQYHIDQARIVCEAGGKLIETDSFKILFLSDELMSQKSHPEEIHGKRYAFEGAMAKLKNKVENRLQREFDLAMCLYYPNGHFFTPYHSDQETSGTETILPSLSLGAARAFSFKEKNTGKCDTFELANGSLLVMADHCQSRYEHSLLKDSKCQEGRINITFRDKNFQ